MITTIVIIFSFLAFTVILNFKKKSNSDIVLSYMNFLFKIRNKINSIFENNEECFLYKSGNVNFITGIWSENRRDYCKYKIKTDEFIIYITKTSVDIFNKKNEKISIKDTTENELIKIFFNERN